jgi:flagellar basal body-associated protein FliL
MEKQATTEETAQSNLPAEPAPEQSNSTNPYGKKSFTKWIVIYLVIAVVLYGVAYFLFLSKKSNNPYSPSSTYSTPTYSPTPATSTASPTSPSQTNLNPSTGNLYGDIKTRLQEVIK